MFRHGRKSRLARVAAVGVIARLAAAGCGSSSPPSGGSSGGAPVRGGTATVALQAGVTYSWIFPFYAITNSGVYNDRPGAPRRRRPAGHRCAGDSRVPYEHQHRPADPGQDPRGRRAVPDRRRRADRPVTRWPSAQPRMPWFDLLFKKGCLMDLDLAGKTAVVTGASSGIGLATARALSAAGARVAGAARTITRELDNAAAVTVSADLSTPGGAAALVDTALAEFGGIDILVNNVGGGNPDQVALGGFLDSTDDQWRHLSFRNSFLSRTKGGFSRKLKRLASAWCETSRTAAAWRLNRSCRAAAPAPAGRRGSSWRRPPEKRNTRCSCR
jgi:hypothetical protein